MMMPLGYLCSGDAMRTLRNMRGCTGDAQGILKGCSGDTFDRNCTLASPNPVKLTGNSQ